MQSKHFLAWAHRKNIEIEYIQPGKPIQNAFIESFNSRFKDECLNEEVFLDLEDGKTKSGGATTTTRDLTPLSSLKRRNNSKRNLRNKPDAEFLKSALDRNSVQAHLTRSFLQNVIKRGVGDFYQDVQCVSFSGL